MCNQPISPLSPLAPSPSPPCPFLLSGSVPSRPAAQSTPMPPPSALPTPSRRRPPAPPALDPNAHPRRVSSLTYPHRARATLGVPIPALCRAVTPACCAHAHAQACDYLPPRYALSLPTQVTALMTALRHLLPLCCARRTTTCSHPTVGHAAALGTERCIQSHPMALIPLPGYKRAPASPCLPFPLCR